MAKYIYPAVFTPEEDGGYSVHFPDLESCYTQGDDLQDAHEMASDILCLTLYRMEEAEKLVPKASKIKQIQTDKDAFVSLICADTIAYRKYYDNKAVKKTLTVPAWLNTMAEREGVNFSSVLQKALKKQLHVE